MNITELLLVAFVINLGIALGAGLYEVRIVLPLWFRRTSVNGYEVDDEAMHTIDTGKKFWAFVTTVPLTLLTIANLIFALRSNAPLHSWWVAGAAIVLLERIGTFCFFIPTAIRLQRSKSLPAAKTSAMVLRWTRLNYLRNALTFAAMLLLLKAMLVA